jgi:hypothetical protein
MTKICKSLHTRMRDVRWLPPREDTQTVVSALIKQAKKLPTELYKSLTWDWRKTFRQRDLTPVLRRPVEPARSNWTCFGYALHRVPRGGLPSRKTRKYSSLPQKI